MHNSMNIEGKETKEANFLKIWNLLRLHNF